MLQGRIRQNLWWFFCFLGIGILSISPTVGAASVPPKDLAQKIASIPASLPKSSLERQLNETREVEASLTFSFSDQRLRLSEGAVSGNIGSIEAGDPNTSQLTTRFQLSPESELRVSFLYNQDQPPGQSPLSPASHLLFRYSMDYCVMPHLKVGMSGYLYKPMAGSFAWRSNPQLSYPLFGFGPGIKYDLGRWSFLLRTQLEPGVKDRGEALHNWFRVWYAF